MSRLPRHYLQIPITIFGHVRTKKGPLGPRNSESKFETDLSIENDIQAERYAPKARSGDQKQLSFTFFYILFTQGLTTISMKKVKKIVFNWRLF